MDQNEKVAAFINDVIEEARAEGYQRALREYGKGRDEGYRLGFEHGKKEGRDGGSFGAAVARAVGLTGEDMVQELRRTERNAELVEDERDQFPHDPVWTAMVDAFRRGDRDVVANARGLIEKARLRDLKALGRYEYQIARANAMLAELGAEEGSSD